jgi:hypothetical protein
MYKDILRSIAGIEVFPLLSLGLFLTVFLVVLVWTARLDRGRLARLSRLPLDDGSAVRTARPSESCSEGGRL